MKLSKVLDAVYLLCVVMLCVWLFASMLDVTSHNLDPNPVFQEWNLINIGGAS